jgi:hypothetical protein
VNAQSTFDPKADLQADFLRFSADVMKANQPIIQFLRAFGGRKGQRPLRSH